jgi:hypothetical protein
VRPLAVPSARNGEGRHFAIIESFPDRRQEGGEADVIASHQLQQLGGVVFEILEPLVEIGTRDQNVAREELAKSLFLAVPEAETAPVEVANEHVSQLVGDGVTLNPRMRRGGNRHPRPLLGVVQ